ncbi:MAG: GGDEF domain-containing response regulator [Thermoanaerobaculia bacterium]
MPEDLLRRRTDQDAGDSAPLRALVVDDHDRYREHISRLATSAGFSVTACADGAEALAALVQGADYQLLIIDCEMPRVNGFALIAAVREQKRFADVYAVMLSAREDTESKVSALRLGFDDYIVKSAHEAEIVARLSAARRLVLRQTRLDATVRELYGLATRDELTGLNNRRVFFIEAEHLIASNAVVNLVFFDLDGFKQINDTFGHLAGDRILRDIGAMFLSRTRHEDLIVRYGGDEFVMLIRTLTPPEVETLAGRMASAISDERWDFDGATVGIGVTTGIACSSLLEHPTISQLLNAGDRDLYKNKWVKRNPDLDPSLYEYDRSREGRLVEIVARKG